MYCRKCGKKIEESSAFCPFCGEKQWGATGAADFGTGAGANGSVPPYGAPPPRPAEQDAPSGGFAVLCFFFTLIGLILYLVWKDTMPLRARSCGKGALIGVIVGAACFFLSLIAFIILMNYLIVVI